MYKINTQEDIPNLHDLGNVVPEVYKYYQKKITTCQLLTIPGA